MIVALTEGDIRDVAELMGCRLFKKEVEDILETICEEAEELSSYDWEDRVAELVKVAKAKRRWVKHGKSTKKS